MRTGRPTPLVVLTAEERQTLEQWARRPTTAQGLAQRALLVLACASTKTHGEIAATAGVAGAPDHPHDLPARGSPYDGVVDHHHAPVGEHLAHRVELHLDPEVTDPLLGLDE